MDCTRLGALAISYELITEEQLDRCLDLQETSSPPRCLGEILVAEGLVTERVLRRLLSAQRTEIERHGASARFERTTIAKRLAAGVKLREFIAVLEELEGGELHLSPGARPLARVHGSFLTLRPEPLSLEEARRLFAEVLDDEQARRFEAQQSAHFVHVEQGLGRFRVSLFRERKGPAGLFCRIPTTLAPWEDLGLPDALLEVSRLRKGLVLVTGVRGSGKTTTLAALVDLINAERRCHVVCMDETAEFVHESKNSLVTQVEVGRNVANWDLALSAALRLDPDVIVAGDLNTSGRLAIALRAAETGHLVLGTLPTERVAQAFPAMICGCGVERRDQVCSSLAGLVRFVVAQQLIPDQEGERRHLACEVMRNTAAVANMIREQRFHQLGNVIQTSRDPGMITLDESLCALVRADKISAGDALARAEDPEHLFARLGAAGGRT